MSQPGKHVGRPQGERTQWDSESTESRSRSGDVSQPERESSRAQREPTQGERDPAGSLEKDTQNELAGLLRQLEQKGERLGEQNYASALVSMYTHEEAQEAVRLPLLQPGSFVLSLAQRANTARVMGCCRAEFFHDWPERSPDADSVELRILLDDKLVPTFVYTGGAGRDAFYRGFAGLPEAHLMYVRRTFGTPTAETDIERQKVLTYGRLRVVADADGKIEIVVF